MSIRREVNNTWLTLPIPQASLDRLTDTADRRGWSRSQLVRRIIADYFRRLERARSRRQEGGDGQNS